MLAQKPTRYRYICLRSIDPNLLKGKLCYRYFDIQTIYSSIQIVCGLRKSL
ncbi:hypothetical protein M3J09_003064 [Ascochyta lentis]